MRSSDLTGKDARIFTQQEYEEHEARIRHNARGISVGPLFDELFDEAGLFFGQLTEVVGVPGTGKTTFGMQACINALLAHSDLRVLYIDTMSNFTAARFQKLLPQHLKEDAARLEQFMDRFTLIRLTNFYLFFGYIMQYLHDDLNDLDDTTALIVIDNVSMPFKSVDGSKSLEDRMKLTERLAIQLARLADFHHAAILAVNTMTTKFADNILRRGAYLAPSLGRAWDEWIDHRLVLFPAAGGYRVKWMSRLYAGITKSRSLSCVQGIDEQDRVIIKYCVDVSQSAFPANRDH